MPKDPTPPESIPFEKIRTMTQKVIATPKSEVEKRDKEWRARKYTKGQSA